MHLTKRAQVSIFIIVGLVVVMSGGIFFYLQNQTTKFLPEEIVPAEIVPIRDYTKACIADVASRAVGRMGEQGGYIDIPRSVLDRRDAAINIFPGTDVELPMWYYGGKRRNPTVLQMEEELAYYIQANIAHCFDFSPFQEKFTFEQVSPYENFLETFNPDDFVAADESAPADENTADEGAISDAELAAGVDADVGAEAGAEENAVPEYSVNDLFTEDISVSVEVNDEDIIVEVEKPFRIKDKAKERQTEMSQYIFSLPVRLKKVVELGEKITDAQARDGFFEGMTINLMSSNEKIPFTNMEFDCGKKMWVIQDIKTELQNMLYQYTPSVRVKNTGYPAFENSESYYEDFRAKYHGNNPDQWADNIENIDATEAELAKQQVPEDIYEYFSLFWDAKLEEPQDEMKVSFEYYPKFNLALRAYPSEGAIMKSNTGKGAQKYLSFMCINVYHFTYDVTYPIEVRIYDAESYNGQGYEMRFALPVVIRKNEVSRQSTGYEPYFGPEYDLDFCDDTIVDEFDEEREFTVTVKDKNDLAYSIPDVNLSFVCLNYECPLGRTWIDEETYSDYNLKTALPSGCQNGFVVAEKEGYLGDKKQFNTADNLLELRMREIKQIPFTVQRYLFMNPGSGLPWSINPEPYALESETTATIFYTLNEQSTGNSGFYVTRDYPYTKTAIYVNGSAVNKTYDYAELPLDRELTYDLNIILKDRKGEVIGGYMGTWTTTYAELVNAEQVVFNVIDYRPRATDDPSRLEMYTTLATNEQYKAQLKPRII